MGQTILKKIKNEKKGSLILLMSMMMVLLLLPFLGIIVDYNNMRMFVTDVKNIQDVSGIACISHGTGNTSEIGAFDGAGCGKTITTIFKINTGNEVSFRDSSFQFKPKYIDKNGTWFSGLHYEGISPGHFSIRAQGEKKTTNGNITYQAGKYCPIILHKKILDLLHVQIKNGEWDGNCIKVYVPPTTFSATYKMNS